MSWVDIAIIVILGVAAWNGLRAGLIIEMASIFGIIIGLAVAKLEYHPVRNALESFAPKGAWLTVIAYLIVFLLIWFLIMTLARTGRRVIYFSAAGCLLGPIDRFGGAILGFVQGAFFLELLLYLGKRVPSHELHHAISQSALAGIFIKIIPYLHHLFPAVPHR